MTLKEARQSLKPIKKGDADKKKEYYESEQVHELLEKVCDEIATLELELSSNQVHASGVSEFNPDNIPTPEYEMPPDEILLRDWESVKQFFSKLEERYNLIKDRKVTTVSNTNVLSNNFKFPG